MKIFLLLIFSIFHQSAAVPDLTQNQVNNAIHYWQHVMRLDDLEIYGEIVPLNELPKDTAGTSNCIMALGACKIQVLQPNDYSKLDHSIGDQKILDDIENTIVHELVHIRLRNLSDIYKTKTVECIISNQCMLAEEYVVVRLTSSIMEGRGSHLK